MRVIARPIFPWVGGKEKLAPFVLQVFPAKISIYLEPFGGSGSILLGLRPDPARLDIYNDYDWDLANLFICVRDCLLALLRELSFIPLHCHAEFDDLTRILRREPLAPPQMEPWVEKELEVARTCFPPEEAMELEEILLERAELRNVKRAAGFWRSCRGSYNGTRTFFGVKKNNIRRFFYLFVEASKRLKDVVIENQDAAKIIQDRDADTTLIYCDPPYYEAEKVYKAQFKKRDHVRLYHTLKKCRGYVVVSYNDCPYIRNLYKDFFIQAFRRDNPMSRKQGAKYGELIITNYDPRPFMDKQLDLFDAPCEKGAMELVRIPKKALKVV